MTRIGHSWSLAAVVVFSLCAAAPGELLVERVEWGVDGKLREGRFNLVSVYLQNIAATPFEGDISLRTRAGLQTVDVPIVHPDVYIEGHGARTVQFVVFVPNSQSYEIRWGRSLDESFSPDDDPSVSRVPAIVQLVAEGQLETGSVPTFDDADFPTSVAGFDAVEAILLNHLPRWDDIRFRALKDWIHQGGSLHLFEDSVGRFPEFGPALSELNEPSDEFTLGGGRVVRHHVSIRAADHQYLFKHIPSTRIYLQQTPFDANQNLNQYQYSNASAAQSASLFRSMLTRMTQPDHQWGLIYFLAMLYLIAIFPGCWLIGRKRGDFRVTYAAVIGVIVLFSAGFRAVGARGYGEQTVFNTLAVVRPVTEGRAKATLWSNFFVTSGGQFSIKHQAEGTAYGSGQSSEGVLGRAWNRPYGSMAVDIPSFSGRSLVGTGVFKVDSPRLEVVHYENDSSGNPLLQLRLLNSAAWPVSRVHQADVLLDKGLHTLVRTEDVLNAQQPARSLTDEATQIDSWAYQYQYRYGNEQPMTIDQIYLQARTPLLLQDLGLGDASLWNSFSLPPQTARVYLYCDLPAELHAQVSVPVLEQGRALFVIDVPLLPGAVQSNDIPDQEKPRNTDDLNSPGEKNPPSTPVPS